MSEIQKYCPRCKKAFTCNKQDIAACACARITLRNETKEFLTKTFYDCLCNECLLMLDELVAREKEFPFPGRGGELVEGVHYYNEDIYRVFTEFYHISGDIAAAADAGIVHMDSGGNMENECLTAISRFILWKRVGSLKHSIFSF